MKKIVTILLLFISVLGFGQTVSAPDSKSFIINTASQDASGFVLSGFNANDILLTSISLVNPPVNTTFYLNTTTGLTAASGFTLTGNKTRLVVTGTMANINLALATLKINTGATAGNVQLSVATTINPSGYYYNGVNGHFYKPVSGTSTYTVAKTTSATQSFKGQTGYLVTITSQSEQDFIVANVPGNNIWIALSDRLQEGYWRVDAGPENGTLLKTANGQYTGNIAGVYNNWCGGEPNNAGGENYAVTKWGGGGCWNDLPDGAGWTSGYVVEYGTWSNPDDANFTEFYTNSVTHSNGEVLSARFDIDFGSNVDETKFSAKGYTYTNNTWNIVNNTPKQLSGLGKVDLTSGLDTAKIAGSGYKASTTAGQVEWCVVYGYDATNQRYRVGIDSREVNGIISTPSTITHLQLFDLWNGPVTFNSYDPNGWTEVYIYTQTQLNFSGSSFASNIRVGNGYYALQAEFTFTQPLNYKPHGIELSYVDQTQLNTLYSSIVGVSDVYLAFKELANGGIFGNQSGLEFGYGIQYMNADVDRNGVFNETDTYKLLQHLTGVQPLSQYTAITYLMKLYNKSEYDAITKSNWSTQFNYTRNLIPFTLSGLNNSYNISVSWLGDVNLSHSATPLTNGITNMSANFSEKVSSMSVSTNQMGAELISELSGDSVYVYITFKPGDINIVGTQFLLNYDNSLLKFNKTEYITNGSPTNYSADKGTFINVGSLNTDGSQITSATYKVLFTTKQKLNGVLGLISVGNSEAVSKDGKSLIIKIQ